MLCEYLALEGSYLPYSACTLKQTYSLAPSPPLAGRDSWTARLQAFNLLWARSYTGLSGRGVQVLGKRSRIPTLQHACDERGFRVGLIRFHSQLLTESRLISSTPLIYMLKLRG